MTNPLPKYAFLLKPKGLGSSAKTDLDRWIQREEVLALLAAARKGKEKWAADAYDAFVLLANLGLRVGEIPTLQLSNFNYLKTHNAINIATLKKNPARRVKNRDFLIMTPVDFQQMQQKIRAAGDAKKKPVLKTIYVGAKEKPVLLALVERRRKRAEAREGAMFYWGKRMLQYLFNYYRGLAKLRPELSPHSMRRFVATHINESVGAMKGVQAGESSRMAARRLRHQEDLVQEHYIQLSPERQIELLAKVEPLS